MKKQMAEDMKRLVLTDPERSTLAVIGKRLGRRGLEPVASAGAPTHVHSR